LVAAYFLFGSEHTGFAILVAFLVGFCVRAMATTKGHASYVRGALTALVAIAAFVGGKFIVAEIATRQMIANAAQPLRVSSAPPEQADQDAANATAEATSESGDEATRDEVARSTAGGAQRRTPRGNTSFSTWDFIWLSVAALIAYELGRGSGTAAPAASTTATPSPPAAPA
jgi:hypothetical protein